MVYYIQDPFLGNLYVFYFMIEIIWIRILYVLSHDVSNAFFHHVTPHCRKFIILGKAGRFSQKQVWACLVKTGNDSAIFQGYDSRMIFFNQLKAYP